jgi:Transglutaminase-like superfamily
MLHDFRYPDAVRYRNVAEAQVVRFLCSPFELAAGRLEQETRAMVGLLDHLVAIGLPFRQGRDGSRLFDLGEIVNFIKFAHHAWGEPIWLERSVATMRRLTLEQDIGAGPALPSDHSQRTVPAYAVTLTRRFAPGALRPGSVLRLNMPKPLNAAPGTHRVAWLRTDSAVQEPSDDGSRYCIKVRLETSSETVVALRHEFVPSPTLTVSQTAVADEARYLRHREGLVVVTPRITALADRLGLDAAAPRRSLQQIWDYLFDELSFGFIQYDRLATNDPLSWGLDNRRVDCRTGSALIVALCRAASIPARMITGYTLNPVLGTSHTWVEVWIDGEEWVPFDTYAIDLAGDQRDSLWRQHFFGRIDQRFVAEVLPTHFCGLGSPRLPSSWQLSMGLTDEGATTCFHEVETFSVLYKESVAVQLIDLSSTKASPLRPATVTPSISKSNTESPCRKEAS